MIEHISRDEFDSFRDMVRDAINKLDADGARHKQETHDQIDRVHKRIDAIETRILLKINEKVQDVKDDIQREIKNLREWTDSQASMNRKLIFTIGGIAGMIAGLMLERMMESIRIQTQTQQSLDHLYTLLCTAEIILC